MLTQTIKKNFAFDWLTIFFLILLACFSRLLYLCDWVVADPMVFHSGLFSVIKLGRLPGLDTIDPSIVYSSVSVGHRAALDWLSGSIPWWNSYEGIGVPLAGSMCSAALFLPFILLLYFSKGFLFFQIVLQCITGISTYYLLRQLKLSRAAAIAGGALYELNGTFVWLHCAPSNPIPFLPLLLLGIEKTLEATKESKAGGWALISIALAASLYAGFPETAYIDGLLAALWTIVRFCQISKNNKFAFCQKIALGGSVGLMLAAPILVAFFDYLSAAFVGCHTSNSIAHVKIDYQYIPQIFMPYLYGPIFSFEVKSAVTLRGLWGDIGGYLGAAPLFFCLLSLLGSKEKIIKWMLLGWILFSFAKTFDLRPIADIVNSLPLMKLTAFARYAAPSWELAVALLVAFALDDLCLYSSNKVGAIFLAALSIGLIILVPKWLADDWIHQLLHNPDAKNWVVYSRIFAQVSSISTIFLTIVFRPSKLKASLIATALILEILTLFTVPALSCPQQAVMRLGGVNFLKQNLGLNRFYTLGPIEPNVGSYFGIASINHNDLPIPEQWVNYVQKNLYKNSFPPFIFLSDSMSGEDAAKQLNSHLPNYQWLGVKYIVTPPKLDLLNYFSNQNKIGVKKVYADQVMRIYESPTFSPYFETISSPCSLTAHSRTELDTDSPTLNTLVRRELFFPGWTATVNGAKVPVQEYKNLFQSIKLPAGHSHICFSYLPPYMEYASVICFLACLILLFQAFKPFLKTKEI